MSVQLSFRQHIPMLDGNPMRSRQVRGWADALDFQQVVEALRRHGEAHHVRSARLWLQHGKHLAAHALVQHPIDKVVPLQRLFHARQTQQKLARAMQAHGCQLTPVQRMQHGGLASHTLLFYLEPTLMKYAVLVSRILLGLIFLIFGANHIVPFLPMQAMTGDAGIFATVLATHKYFAVIGLIDVVAGLLLLVGRFVPLALTLLGPIIVNIFLFTVLIQHGNPGLVVILILLEAFLISVYRRAFAGIFSAGPEVMGSSKL